MRPIAARHCQDVEATGWRRRSSSGGGKKGGERARTRRPLPPQSSREHLGGEIPQAAIDPHVLLDGADPPGADQATTGGPARQSAPEQVLLDLVQGAIEIIPSVLRPPTLEQLRGRHSSLRRVGVPQRQSPLSEPELLVLEQLPLLHALDLGGQYVEPLRDAERMRDNVIDDVAAVGHAEGRKRAPRDDQSIGTDHPKDAHTQLVGARPVVAIQKDDLR